MHQNIWVLFSSKQETKQQDVPDQGDPVWICGCITGCQCQRAGLRATEFTTHFPPWKEWVIPACSKNRAAVWCVFICVYMKVSESRIGSGCTEKEKESAVETSGGVINRRGAQRALCARVAVGSHTRSYEYTHTLPDPLPPPPPKGTFHSEGAQHEQGELIINNTRNEEKMRAEKKAEERHDRERGENAAGISFL